MGRSMRYVRPRTAPEESLVAFLSRKFAYFTEDQWRDHVRAGRLEVNGSVATDGDVILCQQDQVTYHAPQELEPCVDSRIDVLHVDDVMIVVSKSGNIPVAEGGRYSANTLVQAVRNAVGGNVFPVHRLDKETSGVVVLARKQDAAAALCSQFAANSTDGCCAGGAAHKEYDALVASGPALAAVGVPVEVRLRIGHATEGTEAAAKPSAAAPLAKMRMACFPATSEFGKHAHTVVTPVAVRGAATLVRVKLLTGRTHQIRLHCAALGCPVIGDKLYLPGGQSVADAVYVARARGEEPVVFGGVAVGRHLLHCAELAVTHPVSGARMAFRDSGTAAFHREYPLPCGYVASPANKTRDGVACCSSTGVSPSLA